MHSFLTPEPIVSPPTIVAVGTDQASASSSQRPNESQHHVPAHPMTEARDSTSNRYPWHQHVLRLSRPRPPFRATNAPSHNENDIVSPIAFDSPRRRGLQVPIGSGHFPDMDPSILRHLGMQVYTRRLSQAEQVPQPSRAWIGVWTRRHQLIALGLGSLVVLVGLGLILPLFFWAHRGPTTYLRSELIRRCGLLADMLSLDFDTNLVTYIEDLGGYMRTVSEITNSSMAKYTLETNGPWTISDGLSFSPLVDRVMVPQVESTYNLSVVDDDDIIIKLGAAAPVVLRVPLPNQVHGYVRPLGHNLLSVTSLADSVRKSLFKDQPALALSESMANERTLSAADRMVLTRSLADMSASHFSVWVSYILIETQLAMRRTLSRETIGPMHLSVVDDTLGVELMRDSPPRTAIYDGSHSVHRHVSVVDRPWTVSCTATNLMRSEFRTPWPYIMLAVLVAATLVIAELVRHGIVDFLRARSMDQHVRHRRAVAHAFGMYSSTIVKSFPDPLLVVDRLGYMSGLNADAVEYQRRCGHGRSRMHVSVASGGLPPSLISPHRRRASTVLLGRCDLVSGTHHLSKGGDFTTSESVHQVVVSEPIPPTSLAASTPIHQVVVFHDMSKYTRALDAATSAHRIASADNQAMSQFLALLTDDFPNRLALIERVVAAAASITSPSSRNPMVDNDPLSRSQRTISLSTCMMTNTAQVVINQQAAAPPPTPLPIHLLSLSPPLLPSLPNPNAWFNPCSAVLQDISDVTPNLRLRNVQLHLKECGRWLLHGSVPTVLATAIPKLVRVATYATRPRAHSWIEPIVNRQQNTFTLHCRGAMWIPPESSVSRFLVCQAKSTHSTHDASLAAEWCGKESRPEYIGDLMHAAMLLTMVTVSTLIAPVCGTLLLSHVNEAHGGFDLVVPLGSDCRILSGSVECLRSDSLQADSSS